jgi:arylsulfatase A-like enzyme
MADGKLAKKPNFLFIITDQHRADHLGCYGNPLVRTPHIDSLAAAGTRYERFYVANPVCMSNRCSLMTGRMPSSHGVYSNGTALSLDSRTFVERLAEEGYNTALIGKSHLQTMTGRQPAWAPAEMDYVFDDNDLPQEANRTLRRGEGYLNEDPGSWEDPEFSIALPYYGFGHVDLCTMHADRVGGSYTRWLKAKGGGWSELRGPENAIPDERYSTPQAWRTRLPEELYPSAYVGDKTIEFLQGHISQTKSPNTGDAPFFIQCSFPDPHHPFTPPGKYWDMYDPDDIQLPESFGKGTTQIEQYLRKELRDGNAQRNAENPFAVTEREAREAIALTYGMITMIDDQIGRILSELDRLGLRDNTVVIFNSDHGDYMGDHGLMLKGPLHLHGMLRVPCIWNDPEAKAKTVTTRLGQTIDIPATILHRAGIRSWYGMQGNSLLAQQDETTNTERTALLIEDDRQRINLGFSRFQKIRTLITDRYRLTIGYPDADNELYDLETDPGEMHNLWDDPSSADIRTRLIEAMTRKMLEMTDPVPLASSYA